MSEKSPSLKRDAVCDRCGSENVKSGADIDDKDGLRGSNRIPIDEKISIALDNYVCTDCGYFESYINDRTILNRIQKQWTRIIPRKDDS